MDPARLAVEVKLTLIKQFNKNPLFDINLIGLIESYDALDEDTVIFGKHYRYYTLLDNDTDLFIKICDSQDLIAIKYMAKNVTIYALNTCMRRACSDHRLEIIDILMHTGANNLNQCLYDMSRYNRINMIKYLLKYKPSNINECLVVAIQHGYDNIVDILIKAGATNINECLLYTIQYNKPSFMAFYLINAGASNLNECLVMAIIKKQHRLSCTLINKGANNFNECLVAASANNFTNIIPQLIYSGASNLDECLEIATKLRHNEVIEILRVKKNDFRTSTNTNNPY
jgi:hypothetical protein